MMGPIKKIKITPAKKANSKKTSRNSKSEPCSCHPKVHSSSHLARRRRRKISKKIRKLWIMMNCLFEEIGAGRQAVRPADFVSQNWKSIDRGL